MKFHWDTPHKGRWRFVTEWLVPDGACIKDVTKYGSDLPAPRFLSLSSSFSGAEYKIRGGVTL